MAPRKPEYTRSTVVGVISRDEPTGAPTAWIERDADGQHWQLGGKEPKPVTAEEAEEAVNAGG